MIHYLQKKGIVKGYDDGSVKLENKINRAEFTKIILEAKEDVEISFDPNFTFPDIKKDAWYAKYISTAKKLNIIHGYPDGTFKPENTINYAEAIKIIANTFEIKKGSAKNSIVNQAKNEPETWYSESLEKTATQNILPTHYWYFAPEMEVNRENSFTLLYKTLIQKEFPTTPFIEPQIIFPEMNGFIFLPPKEQFKIPVSYQNIDDKTTISLFKVPEIETFLQGINSDKQAGLIDLSFITKIEFIDTYEVKIEEITQKTTDANSDGLKQGIINLEVSDPGLYFFIVENDYIIPQHHFLNVSKNMMLAKTGNEKALIWLTERETSKGIENAKIKFYQVEKSYNNEGGTYSKTTIKETKTIETQKDGLILMDKDVTGNYIVAHDNNDFTILQSYFYTIAENEVAPSKIQSYIYTDRSVYRPGDTVNFKAIIRDYINNNYELVRNKDVNIKISNYGNQGENIIFEKKYPLSEFSTIGDSFTLNENDATGSYNINVVIDNQTVGYGSFSVEAYKKDEYAFAITLDKDTYKIGDKVKAEIKGEYFYGDPLKNKQATYSVYRQEYHYPVMFDMPFIDADMERSFMPPYYGNYNTPVLENVPITLDANGIANIEFNAEKNKEKENSYTESLSFTIKVEAVDSSNIPVSETKNLIIYPSAFDFELDEKTIFPIANNPYELEIKTLKHDGKIYKNANLQIEITRRPEVIGPILYNHWVDEYERKISLPQEDEKVTEFTGTTDENGIYTLNFTPDKAGQYIILIKGADENNNEVKNNFYTYINEDSPDSKYLYANKKVIQIKADKEEYNIGDTAVLTIYSQIPEKDFLFSLNKNDILNYEIKKINENTSTVELPITEKHLGGINVSVDILHLYKFFNAETNLKVSSNTKKLNIEITPGSKTYEPKDKATFQISVKDNVGNPVEADFSLGLVDEAIYHLQKNTNSEDVFEQFYPEHNYKNYIANYGTQTGSGQSYGKGFYPPVMMDGGFGERATLDRPEMAANFAIDDSEAEDTSIAPKEAQTPTPAPLLPDSRSNFLDTAYFNLNIQTDSSGQANIEIPLPDNITGWVATGIFNTKDTKLGENTAKIKVAKDFFISTHIPRFAMSSDQLILRTTLHNNLESETAFNVTLTGSGFNMDPSTQDINIENKGEATLKWPIQITDTKEMNIKFIMQQKDTEKYDIIEQKIPVKIFGIENTKVHSGENNAEINISSDSGDLKNINSIIISLTPTITDKITESIKYLVGFPYGCVEQTMSKFLPNVIVYQHKNALNLENDDIFKELPEQVEAGLKRLYNFQHHDGGWGWWENDETNPKNTAYVIYGLTLAKKAGFKVQEDTLQLGITKIENYLTNDQKLSSHLKTYLNYVYILATGTGHSSFDSITENLNLIDHAYLALSYNLLGNSAEAQNHLNILKEKAVQSKNLAYWDEKTEDYESMQSKELTTAIALEAFTEINISDPIVAKIIRYINQNNKNGVYHETHATSHAVIAIAKYISETGENASAAGYQILLNDQEVGAGNITKNKEIKVNLSTLLPENNVLKIVKTSGSKLYYNITINDLVPQETITAENNGFKIERIYLDEKGNEITGPIKAGSIVRVKLNITSTNKAEYIFIKDNLPSGFEPINPALSSNSMYYDQENQWSRQEKLISDNDYYYYSPSNREFRDDHTAIFINNLYNKEQAYFYLARAVTPGTFKVNPAKIEMMYMPEINGRSQSNEITISE